MTDAFIDLFALEAEQRGMPALPHVVIPHPLGGIHDDSVVAKAHAVRDDLAAALLGRAPAATA